MKPFKEQLEDECDSYYLTQLERNSINRYENREELRWNSEFKYEQKMEFYKDIACLLAEKIKVPILIAGGFVFIEGDEVEIANPLLEDESNRGKVEYLVKAKVVLIDNEFKFSYQDKVYNIEQFLY